MKNKNDFFAEVIFQSSVQAIDVATFIQSSSERTPVLCGELEDEEEKEGPFRVRLRPNFVVCVGVRITSSVRLSK